MRSLPLWREITCEKHDLVQSGKSSLKSWPDVKLIPQTKQTNKHHYWKIPDEDLPVGGVAIMVRGAFPQREISLNTPLQAVAVRVTINKPVTLCSMSHGTGLDLSLAQARDRIEHLQILDELHLNVKNHLQMMNFCLS